MVKSNRFRPCPHVLDVFGQKRRFPKTILRVEFFKNRWLLVFVWVDENGGLRKPWFHKSYSAWTCKECHRIFNVSAFYHDRAKMFQIYAACGRFMFRKRRENLRWKKYMCGRGLRLIRFTRRRAIFRPVENSCGLVFRSHETTSTL